MRLTWIESVRDAWREFSLIRGRNLFAFIGILIGTAAVIAILQVAHISRVTALREFEKLGTDVISVNIFTSSGDVSLDTNDILKLPEKNLGVRQVGLASQLGGKIRLGREAIDVSFLAVNESYYDINALEIDSGRFTKNIDKFSLYAVIGDNVNKNIEKNTGKSLSVGDSFVLQDKYFTVIGILKPISMFNIFGSSSNYSIHIPFLAARRLSTVATPSRIMVRLEAGQDDMVAAEKLKGWFQVRAPKATVFAQSARETMELIDKQTRIFGLLLVGIGAISLLVSGIGIMNVMMMNVMEKRQEIGLRRAVGATRGAIICFFLSNAFLLCLSGALGGVVLGIGGGYLFSVLSGLQFVLSPLAVPLAVGMALGVGFFFGIYPASRAARLDIVMALRSAE